MAGSMQSSDDDGGVMSDINVTPLVDVVLVLLIVFMITVPTIIGNTPVRVDLPTTSAALNTVAEQLPLNISLKRETGGKISVYWNDSRVTEEEFRKRLNDSHLSSDQEVSIAADQDITIGETIHIMDMFAAVGIHKIQWPTKHVASSQQQ
jgi:biopolymer transport protein ExbD